MVTLHCEIKEVKQINDLLWEYPKQFDHIGHFPGKYHIVLDPTITPVIHAPTKMSYPPKRRVKERARQDG